MMELLSHGLHVVLPWPERDFREVEFSVLHLFMCGTGMATR